MSQPNLVLIGAGGHAHACIDVIEQNGRYQIAGLVGIPEEIHAQHLRYSVIGSDNDLPELAKAYQYALISMGQIQSPYDRIRLYHRAIELGFLLPAIIAPTAQVSRHATIGAGTIVMHGAIVSTGAILNGSVVIGAGGFIGSGSVIKEGVTLGKGCVVGMGLSVRHNLANQTRFVGNDRA